MFSLSYFDFFVVILVNLRVHFQSVFIIIIIVIICRLSRKVSLRALGKILLQILALL